MDLDIASRTLGFVGLGNMGFLMARRLREHGFRLIVHDARSEAVHRFQAEFDTRAASGRRDLAAQSDILILMLPDGGVVRDFLLTNRDDDEAPARHLRPGSIVIDMSSSDPAGTQELGAELRKRDIELVDAPVSGGVMRARNGTLAIIVGGDERVAASLWPLFSAMGSSILPVGPLGAGHAMKALNNYVSAAGLVAACEAVLVARKFGIRGETALQVLNSSTGKNNSTENKIAQFVLSQKFDSGFALGLMRKDLATAGHLARHLKMRLPLADNLLQVWEEGEKTLGANADHTEIARLVT